MAVAPVGGWLAVGGRGGWEPWLLGAGDRHVGRRLRRALRLPGSRLRSRARPAVDSGALRRARGRSRSRASCTSSPSPCLLALALVTPLGAVLSRRRRAGRGAAGLRAVARARRRSVAGQARVRSERLRRHPVSARAGGRRSMSADSTDGAGRSRSRSPARAARSTPTRTLAALLARGVHVELIVSDYGRRLLRDELGEEASVERLRAVPGREVRRRRSSAGTMTLHSNRDLGATIASGSHGCSGMAIVPCSMKTLAGVAHGLSRNLVERAADVMLKEQRRLVIVPRETPMSLPQLKNMVLCAEAGAMILPAMPAFYQHAEDARRPRRLHGGKDPVGARLRARALSAVDRPGRIVGSIAELRDQTDQEPRLPARDQRG